MGLFKKKYGKNVTRDNEFLKEYAIKVNGLQMFVDNNQKVYDELEALKDKVKPNITLLPFGFRKDAPELYGACDLFITKAGPNAVLDSVMMGTPIIMDYYGSPIEHATKRLFIDNKKCGYYIPSPKKIRKAVERLASSPDEMATLEENIKFFDKTKNGAEQIADDLYENVCGMKQ